MINNKCPICDSNVILLDVVDFNKSCEEARGIFSPLSGRPVYYSYCNNCTFTFAPDFKNWSEKDFLDNIYNDKYIDVDPDYLVIRPQANFNAVTKAFDEHKDHIKHLDYGGGNGCLSRLLQEKGWKSQTYDPFPCNNTNLKDLGKFNLITAFEVFEHVPDVNSLMSNLTELMDNPCLTLFSTLVSDGNIKPNNRINWWYASPRNGHISLFSKKSLVLLGKKNKLSFGSFSDGSHCYINQIPFWARHIIK